MSQDTPALPSLDELINAAERTRNSGLQRHSRLVNSKNFPDVGIRPGLVVLDPETDLGYSFDKPLMTAEIVAAMSERGYLPGTVYEMVHTAFRFRHEFTVVALGSIGHEESLGVDYACYIWGPSFRRFLSAKRVLHDPWSSVDRFLAVRGDSKEK